MAAPLLPDAIDLATDSAAHRARKRPVPVRVVFAAGPGALRTQEGEVRYAAGDALVTSEAGDRWPVPRAKFSLNYEPIAPTMAGHDGNYRKRAQDVLARRMSAPFAVTLAGGRGTLRGGAGDWLVQYAPDDQSVVGAAIFAQTYDLTD
jgi:hypothetical protein